MYFSLMVFIVPWIIGIIHLHSKNKKIIPLIGSFTSVISYLINEFWIYFSFGEIYPFAVQKTLPGLPFNIGIYPVIGCYLIFFIMKKEHPYLLIFFTALCMTLLEYILVFTGLIIYRNGWNIFWTYVAYLSAFALIYWFYLYLKKLKVME
ncbi:hypothetical protein RRU94_17595 [Domibacillus sp. DTU_2020_1001157_1_SI_ALB_TIR_016]|uniref:hypothetical protein n=1 Tax=Domibacillus sp. DTU_2020_1001157_1_SI_ALB_TIR_016 TaxID=3077789 RepID=UPI0028EBB37D|nr:hypothetical protein [Domibacillus sp. DTU_2020_1001157_1_SI_ALB_TIR_016]WNS79360.1 hypothetical protein RRU94_17595 [Domibacillus sp. DTU_2020_1001157_1_SI_ALB_TIR_016]